MKSILRHVLVTVAVVLGGFSLAGCGDKLSGTYSSPNGDFSIEFKSGNKAYLKAGGDTMEADYTVDGDKIVFDTHSVIGKPVFTRQGDTLKGSLGIEVVLTKKS